jgi:D-sedoheptulose 7-phosphate isomerase
MNVRKRFEESARILVDSRERLADPLEHAVRLLLACLRGGGKILTCGNGGSAADAQHLAAELVCRVRHDRPALPAVALTSDTSVLTAIANDLGFERVFARQVEALARENDVLVTVSTSGNSPNVLAAAGAARRLGCQVIALTGEGGGQLAEHANVLVDVPSNEVAQIQEIHGLCIHVLAELVEEAFLDGRPHEAP